MRLGNWGLVWGLVAVLCSMAFPGLAQDSAAVGGTGATTVSGAVPGLINYSGVLKDLNGKAITGLTGVTFLLYKDEQGDSPLWIETQNITPDRSGHYIVTLGSTKVDASLADSFASGEARWLGVQIAGQPEQPRVLLVAVPYALKAGDAQTIGGLPASAFMLASGNKAPAASANGGTTSTSSTAKTSAPVNPNVTGKGVVNFIPMWDAATDIVDSAIFQKSGLVGIGTTGPAAMLDVNGKGAFRDTLTLVPKSPDNSLAINGTAFKIDSTGKVTFISSQTFPGAGTITGITTASGSGLSGGGTSGTLSLKVPAAGITNAMLQNSKVTLNANSAGGITAPGAMSLGSTYTIGLKACAANQVLQYNGTTWNCAGVGTGTVTSVGSGTGLTGGPITGSGTLSIASGGVTNTMLQNPSLTVAAGTDLTGGGLVTLGGTTTLNVDVTKVPQLNAANSFVGNQAVIGNLSATSEVSAGNTPTAAVGPRR
jgi:hypothetical protein